jgi:hypothetical protein
MFTPGRILALFVGGGIGLALCDQIHVQAGVLDYETGGFFGQAWWVPLQFGVAAVAIVAGAVPFAAQRAKPKSADFVTDVEARGARIVSAPRARILRLAACRGAREVSVTVDPGSGTPHGDQGCA